MVEYPIGKGGSLKNTSKLGDTTAAKILSKCIENNIKVFLPFGDGYKIDQIWLYKNIIYRVQIKTSRKIQGKDGIVFNGYSVSNGIKHRYTEEDIDLFATYWDNQVYIVPVQNSSLDIKLWFTTKSNEKDKMKFAKDYSFDIFLDVTTNGELGLPAKQSVPF